MSSCVIKKFSIEKRSPKTNSELNIFSMKNVKDKVLIGRGSFGEVFKAAYFQKTVVVKNILGNSWDNVGRQFMKEASLIKHCESPHIVAIYGISYEPLALMLSYEAFSFHPFEKSAKIMVYSLDKFLEYVNTFDARGMEAFIPEIAKQVAAGTWHMHNLGKVFCILYFISFSTTEGYFPLQTFTTSQTYPPFLFI